MHIWIFWKEDNPVLSVGSYTDIHWRTLTYKRTGMGEDMVAAGGYQPQVPGLLRYL